MILTEPELQCMFAVNLPGDTRRIVSSFRSYSRIDIFFILVQWLRDGHKAYTSTDNVVWCYEEVPRPYLGSVRRPSQRSRPGADNYRLHFPASPVSQGVTCLSSGAIAHQVHGVLSTPGDGGRAHVLSMVFDHRFEVEQGLPQRFCSCVKQRFGRT